MLINHVGVLGAISSLSRSILGLLDTNVRVAFRGVLTHNTTLMNTLSFVPVLGSRSRDRATSTPFLLSKFLFSMFNSYTRSKLAASIFQRRSGGA